MSPSTIYSFHALLMQAVIAHELGHLFGLVHMHQRYDRNEYIRLNIENIAPSKMAFFRKFEAKYVTDLDIPYDYGSVMHYKALVST